MQVKDRAQRHAAVEPIQQAIVPGERRYPRLNPRICGDRLRAWNREVSHNARRFGMFAEARMQKAMAAAVLIHVRERQLIAEGILLQKPEHVTDSDAVVRSWEQAGAVEIGTRHDEEIIGRPGHPSHVHSGHPLHSARRLLPANGCGGHHR